MTTDVMIEAKGLTKAFGSIQALDGVSFQVRRGEVVGFLGPNGAGKSTTMRILTCFLSPTEGSASVHGLDVFDDSLGVRRHLGYLPQRAPLYTDMIVEDYLRFAAELRKLDRASFGKRIQQVVEICGLQGVLNRPIGDLSHGYRQRVGLGQALIHDPPILILDEPTSDLDPNEKAELLRYIRQIGQDRTVLLSTHNLAEVEAACGRAIIISGGRVVADGPLSELRGDGRTQRYLITLAGDGKPPPSFAEAAAAYGALQGATSVTELPPEDGQLRVQFSGGNTDLRADIFRVTAARGWLLLESRREGQSLDDVFRQLTIADTSSGSTEKRAKA